MNIEKALRQFVRAQFSARVKKVEGQFQSSVKGSSGRVLIQNTATVEEHLREQAGKAVEEKGKTTVFTIKRGKKAPLVVALTPQNDGGAVLKLDGLDFDEEE